MTLLAEHNAHHLHLAMMKLLILALLFGTGAARVGDSRARDGTPKTLAAIANAKTELDAALSGRGASPIAQGLCAKELNDLNHDNNPLIVYDKAPREVIGHGSVAASNSPSNTKLKTKNVLAPQKTTERPLDIKRAEASATKWETCCKVNKDKRVAACDNFAKQQKVNVATVKLATAKAADIKGDNDIIQANHAASKKGSEAETGNAACPEKSNWGTDCTRKLENLNKAKAAGREGAGLDRTRDPWKWCCNCMMKDAKAKAATTAKKEAPVWLHLTGMYGGKQHTPCMDMTG